MVIPVHDFRTARALPALIAASTLLSGCYRYVATPIETIPPGQTVRVLVTTDGADELSTVVDVQGRAATVTGSIVALDGDEVLMQVPVAQRREGFIASTINQTVRVPLGEIVTAERRELDGLTTGLLIGGGVAVTAAVVGFIIKPFGRSEPGPGDGPEDFLTRIPLVTIPVGR